MPGPRLTALTKQFNDVKEGITKIEQTATSANRDVTDAEQADLDNLFARAATLKPEIDAEAAKEDSITATSAVLARINGSDVATSINRAAVAAQEKPTMTGGEFFSEFFRAYHPQGDSAPEEFIARAGQYIDRALQTTADTAGLLPTPIVGQIVKLADARRPAFNAMKQATMPAKGKTFERPRVTQRVTVAEQAAEGDALSTQKMVLVGDTVTKRTGGGTLDLSAQDIDWTEPSALQTVIDDFIDTYVEWTEGLACAHLLTLIDEGDTAVDDSTYSPWVTTNVGTIVDSFVDACVKVYGKAKRMPDTAWLDLASWAVLAGTTNTNNDRTALSMVKEALGELGVGGFKFVMAPKLASDIRVIGCSSLTEAYEQQKGLLRAELPGSLKTTIAYAGYVAFWGNHNGFVQLATDPD